MTIIRIDGPGIDIAAIETRPAVATELLTLNAAGRAMVKSYAADRARGLRPTEPALRSLSFTDDELRSMSPNTIRYRYGSSGLHPWA